MLHHGLFVLLYQKVSRMKGQRTKTICIVQHSISNGANGDHRKRLVNMKRLTGYCLIFLFSCLIGGSCGNPQKSKISSDYGGDTIYTTFNEYDKTVLSYEEEIIKHIKQEAIIIAQDSNSICNTGLKLIGTILNSENDTITLLEENDVFGLLQCPHGNGKIVVYKNKIRQGYYSNFYKGFFAEVKNNLLCIKDVMDVDSEGNFIFGKLNLIDFRKEIPNNIFIYVDNEFGDEHVFINKTE